ncbi:MAG: response regulator [Paludibacteraceae bacterium]|nr:response regulator [Paludibacteraceae bacterium]
MIKVFIVDDHEIIRRGLKMILKDATDLTVVGEAQDGTEALAKVPVTDIDVLLLDMNMPGKCGIELLTELKALKPEVQILILTIHPEDKFALKTLKSGASGYLCKDTALEELVNAIRKVQSKGRYISPTLAEQLAFDLVPNNPDTNVSVLNEKEQFILIKIASGEKIKNIAQEMKLSISTVFSYRMRIFEKLKLSNNVELTHYAIENKLVS